ncbi:MAG: MBL fold metallo-hydrolase [Myxococcota bacterium]
MPRPTKRPCGPAGLPVLLVLAGCAAKIPAPPPRPSAPTDLDRAALPDVTLRGMVVATTRMSRHLAVMGGEKTDERGPVYVYVVQHPDHGTLLIDAGYPRRTAVDPTDHPGKMAVKLLGLEMGEPAADQLADLGLEPADIDAIVLTHIHDDHAAGVEDFPGAMLWMDRLDWQFADHARPLKGVAPEMYAGRDVRHPTYTHGPWGPFERHTDLFGDGTVLLFPAPGHTPGSLLVLVNTPSHSWLFLGDAAWTDDGWNGPQVKPKGWLPRSVLEDDWKRGIDVLYRVQTLVGRDDLTIVSGHEPRNVDRLPPWPEPWTTGSSTGR